MHFFLIHSSLENNRWSLNNVIMINAGAVTTRKHIPTITGGGKIIFYFN